MCLQLHVRQSANFYANRRKPKAAKPPPDQKPAKKEPKKTHAYKTHIRHTAHKHARTAIYFFSSSQKKGAHHTRTHAPRKTIPGGIKHSGTIIIDTRGAAQNTGGTYNAQARTHANTGGTQTERGTEATERAHTAQH